MPIEIERNDEPAALARRQAAARARLWVQFHDDHGPGPAYGPFTEVDAEMWCLNTRDRDGTEDVLARRLDAPDELGAVEWELDDTVVHPGERWPRFVISSRRPATVPCGQCAERARASWSVQSEIRNAAAYRTLVRWAKTYGLRLYPDAAVGVEIFAPLRARRSRPEVAAVIRTFGPLKSYDDAEILDALAGNRSAVYVTALRLAHRRAPALLDRLPDGAWVATARTSGLLAPGAAGVALARVHGGSLSSPEVVFDDPTPVPRLIVGLLDDEEALVVDAARMVELELLAEVLSRPVPRRSYLALLDLLPGDGNTIVEALENAFLEDDSLPEVVPTEIVEVDDLPWLRQESAHLLEELDLDELLTYESSALDGDVASLPASQLKALGRKLDKKGIEWVRSDTNVAAVWEAIGGG